jgi:hypothetical protein
MFNYTQHHRHLGLTLSDDGTWHEHINNITNSASKILGSMRLLKFKLNRIAFNQIYISYMRPLYEYASVIWDSCTLYEKEKKNKKMQYEAKRLVNG